MKEILKNIKFKLVALWWFLTRKNYYLLSYNGKVGKTLESYNVIIPEFIFWLQKKHGYITNHEIIMELKVIASASDDKLVRQMIIDLIKKIKEK